MSHSGNAPLTPLLPRLHTCTHSHARSCRYVLLFPTGQGGWFQEWDAVHHRMLMPTSTASVRLTLRTYAKCALYQRATLHRLPSLATEWMLDMYSRAESLGVLSYLRRDAAKRMDRAAGAAAARRLASAARRGLPPVAKARTHIPASVPGSPRHRQCLEDDCVAIWEKHGPASFLITASFNPRWEAVRAAMADHPGQTIFDRPDLQARIFSQKVRRFTQHLRAGEWFNGSTLVYLFSVIEFQEQGEQQPPHSPPCTALCRNATNALGELVCALPGLPHLHMVCRMNNPAIGGDHQPTTPEEIANVVSAEMPPHPSTLDNPTPDDVTYYNLVASHMIHTCTPSRCGRGACRFGYPFHVPKYQASVDNKGFVHYARLKGSDARVVPHNRELLLFWRSHTSVAVAHHAEPGSMIAYLRVRSWRCSAAGKYATPLTQCCLPPVPSCALLCPEVHVQGAHLSDGCH